MKYQKQANIKNIDYNVQEEFYIGKNNKKLKVEHSFDQMKTRYKFLKIYV